MVVMDVANPFFTDIVSGVEDYVHDLGYSVQLGNSAQQTEREAAHVQLFEQHRVRGYCSPRSRKSANRLPSCAVMALPL